MVAEIMGIGNIVICRPAGGLKEGRGGYHQEDVKHASAGKEEGGGPRRDG